MQKTFSRPKNKGVQLTTLLDLLFVMIFVSLMSQKKVTESPKPVAKDKPIQKVKAKPTPKVFTVSATFHFHGTQSNPNIPSGKYLMQGKYDEKSGDLRLAGIGWLERPKNYDMVPLLGKLTNKNIFIGKIDFPGCKEFTLKRENPTSNTPISGVWKGAYECGQGSTGLTLTID